MKLLVATKNRGKVRELELLFAEVPGIELVSLADLPGAPEVDEDGATFEANAVKKACEYAAFAGLTTLADDSGLEVDALGGAPGVCSARFAREHDDAANNALLLEKLTGVPDAERTARFRCVLALAEPSGAPVRITDGRVEGRIARAPRGNHGFGYDPLFLVERGDRTMAELDPGDKSVLSHRGRAARAMIPILRELAR